MFGAIEAGGTKMIVAVGDENGNIIREKTLEYLNGYIASDELENIHQFC